MAFVLNSAFSTFKEFETLKSQYQQENYVQLAIVQSDKYQTDHKYFNTLVYRRIHFGCKFGKKKHMSQATKRSSSSYKQNCPFRLILKSVKGKLILKQLNETHNGHPISEKDFKHLPEQRRLTPDETEEAVNFLRSKGNNKKELQKHLIKKTSKVVLLTDIHRMATKMKSSNYRLEIKTSIRDLIEELCLIPNSVVEVSINDCSELVGIHFQEKRMIEALDHYPEIVLVDATYRLPEYGMPVILWLIVNGNGDSEVCCVWIIKNGCREALESMCNAFKKYNPKWPSIEMLISTGERQAELSEAIEEHLPHLHMYCNVYQVLRSIKKEVTVKDWVLDESQSDVVLELMAKMAWANTENEYYEIYNRLKALDVPRVLDYFDKNWHLIMSHWVLLAKRHYFRYMNGETRESESYTHKLRTVISRHSRLQPFFVELMSSVRVDQDHPLIPSSHKVPVAPSEDRVLSEGENSLVEKQIHSTLTAFAYDIAYEEFGAHFRVDFTEQLPAEDGVAKSFEEGKLIETTLGDCSCDFRAIIKLPCRHMFAYRKLLGHQPLFEPNLVARRWLRPYLKPTSQIGNPVKVTAGETLELTMEEKLMKVNQIVKRLGDVISEKPSERFTHYADQCEKLIELINSDKTVEIISVSDASSNKFSRGPNGVSTISLHRPQQCNTLASLLESVTFPVKLTECDQSSVNESFQSAGSSDLEPNRKKLKIDALHSQV